MFRKTQKITWVRFHDRGNEERRLDFCLFCQGEYFNDNSFLGNILFTDQATFTTNGTVFTQISRFWARENPHWMLNVKREYSQKIKNRLAGPVFFKKPLNSERFYNFFNTNFLDFMKELGIEDRRNILFQLDEASIHIIIVVRPMAWWKVSRTMDWKEQSQYLLAPAITRPDLIRFFPVGIFERTCS